MKTIAIFCLFISSFLFAQDELPILKMENKQLKNELGFNLLTVTDFHKEIFPADGYKYATDYNLFSGIYYKYHFGKNAFRTSFDFDQKSIFINVSPNISYYYSENAKQNFVGLKAGYERDFGNKKWKVFVFSDLIFNYENTFGVHSYSGCFGWGENVPFNEEIFEYGIAGGAGIQYAVSKNIVLSYECCAQGFCSTYQDILNSGEKWGAVGYRLNPVSKLGFAVAF